MIIDLNHYFSLSIKRSFLCDYLNVYEEREKGKGNAVT
ncbi:hypothetical protein GXM_09920 [Nostoc sphaeroides CCNUC1]|uniref:Uncharacterized protein n=1 Tax=Nostoc sphaeroides CCNUC1 TaxID=2653204 RepID=A0A5P8WJT7_9NOSO|nr:hypothetical protein GXM_09402 [Nostoc sphaeroides CCNUC1]QFS52426.1 hypothetical protein GXM_09920 [Nostoc sphaeroides CCNUC1]